MAFFCDLVGNTTDDAEKAVGLIKQYPYLLPYSQVLYYNDTSQGGTDNGTYNPIIVAPYNGEPGKRSLDIGITWSDNTSWKSSLGYRNADSEVALINNDADVARKAMERINKKGLSTSEKARTLHNNLNGSVLGRILRSVGLDDFANDAMAAYTTLGDWLGLLDKKGQTEFEKKKMEEDEDGVEAYNTYEGFATQALKKLKEKSDNDSSKRNGMVTAVTAMRDSATEFSTKLNSVTSTLGHGELEISKSIVCKGSTKSDAAACIAQLRKIINVVAPKWNTAHNRTNASTNQSVLSVYYTSPNNFSMETENPKDEKASFFDEAFRYKGDFELRQGYNVYTRLVPTSVNIDFSFDNLLIADATREDIFGEDDKDTGWGRYYSNINAGTGKNQAGSAYFLFPQYITVTVKLKTIEPVDTRLGIRKMFAYGDNNGPLSSAIAKTPRVAGANFVGTSTNTAKLEQPTGNNEPGFTNEGS